MQWCGAGQRPRRLGRGGGEYGAPEALADCVRSGVQPLFTGIARVMVPGGRKRRDSASVGALVLGVKKPGDEGSGELAAGWASGHNRRRRASKELREQPRRAEPFLAGTGNRGRRFPR